MPVTDPRVDAYIATSAPFARPILEHLRAVVHAAVPDVEEAIKWGRPHFMYHGMLCGMSEFKAHCAFGFWRGAQVVEGSVGGAAGDFGRITAITDLPSTRALTALVKKAAALNVAGAATPAAEGRRKAAGAAARKPVPELPADFASALKRVTGATAQFAAMSPSHRREYLEWIVGAKQETTRARRIAKAVEQIAKGKAQNWKYER